MAKSHQNLRKTTQSFQFCHHTRLIFLFNGSIFVIWDNSWEIWDEFHFIRQIIQHTRGKTRRWKAKKKVCSTLDHNKNFSGKSRYVRFQSSCRKWWHWTPELQLQRLRWKLPETNSPDEATTKKICRDFHIFSHARHKFNSAFSSATELMFDNSSPSIQLIKHRSFHLAFHSGLVIFYPVSCYQWMKNSEKCVDGVISRAGKLTLDQFCNQKI